MAAYGPDLDEGLPMRSVLHTAVFVVGVPFGHTRPQWILPHGGTVIVEATSSGYGPTIPDTTLRHAPLMCGFSRTPSMRWDDWQAERQPAG